MYYFLKIGSKKSVSNFVTYIIKFIWFKPGDTEPYPGASLGTLVLCKGLICLYKAILCDTFKQNSRQRHTYNVFNSNILIEMLKLNVWGVDTFTLKIRLNSRCYFAPVFH